MWFKRFGRCLQQRRWSSLSSVGAVQLLTCGHQIKPCVGWPRDSIVGVAVVVRETICKDIELSVSLRPFYLPREFPQLFFTVVFIHPRANSTSERRVIADVTHRLDSLSPDAPKFILGDFNNCDLTKTLKTYNQYVTCPTTQNNTKLDLCYGTIPAAYKAKPMPSFGASYHHSVF